MTSHNEAAQRCLLRAVELDESNADASCLLMARELENGNSVQAQRWAQRVEQQLGQGSAGQQDELREQLMVSQVSLSLHSAVAAKLRN